MISLPIMSFYKNERVRVCGGEHNTQHGKVIEDDRRFGALQKRYKVKLDLSNDLVSIEGSCLDHERLKSHEIDAEIQNLVSYVPDAPELPDNMRKELPNHLKMCGNALNLKNKSQALKEYNYIESYLKILGEGMEDKKISLEKIAWAIKQIP